MSLNQVYDIMLNNGYNKIDILNIYLCGSRLYGNVTDKSDYDYTIIVTEYCTDAKNHNIRSDIDITVMSVTDMNSALHRHDFQLLINILSNSSFLENIIFSVNINKQLLRNKVSEISNKCFNHAKRSFKEGNIYKSKKHIIHSIRYIEFGIQILLYDKIINLSVCNNLFDEIMLETYDTWNDYHNKYKPLAKDLYKNKFLTLL